MTRKRKTTKPRPKASNSARPTVPSLSLAFSRPLAGTIKFLLFGEQSERYVKNTTVYTGDFRRADTRKLIWSQPRYFRFSYHVVSLDGQVAELKYEVSDKLTYDEVAKLLKQYAKIALQELEQSAWECGLGVDHTKSYAILELLPQAPTTAGVATTVVFD